MDGFVNVSFLVVAERNDLHSSPIVTHEFPHIIGEDQKSLAELIFPVNDFEEDYGFFVLGDYSVDKAAAAAAASAAASASSSSSGTDSPKSQKKNAKDGVESTALTVEVYVYEFNPEGESQTWEMKGEGTKIANISRSEIVVIDDSDSSEVVSIKPHLELIFTEVEPRFVAVLTEDNTALGFRFKADYDEEIFLIALERFFLSMESLKQAKRESGTITRYAGPLLRGMFYKNHNISIAVITRFSYVEVFRDVLQNAMKMFKQTPTESTLRFIYDQINSWKFPIDPITLSLSSSARSSKPFVFRSNAPKAFHATLEFPTPLLDDQLCHFDIQPLIKMLDSTVMTLFNAVMTNQRLLIFSAKLPVEFVSRSVVSLAILASLNRGLISSIVHPFCQKSNFSFVGKSMCYIAGVSDEDLIHQKDLWDVMVNMDEGTVNVDPQTSSFSDEVSAHIDQTFFSTIRGCVDSIDANEFILQAFRKYSRRLRDMALGAQILVENKKFLNEVECNRWRTNLWKNSLHFELFKEEKLASPLGPKLDDLTITVNRLTYNESMSIDEIKMVFNSLSSIAATDQFRDEMIKVLHETGMLTKLAFFIWHQSPQIREIANSFYVKHQLQNLLSPLFGLYTSKNTQSNPQD